MIRFHRGALSIIGALVPLLFAAAATATTVIEKSLDDLCKEADMVFVGKVVEVQPRWRAQERRSIETEVTFAVLEPLYGTRSGDVKLSFSGGDLDGLREVVAGVPQFQPGEEVLVFATNEPSVSPIVGFHQGCFRVVDGGGGPIVLDAENRSVSLRGRASELDKRAISSGVSLDDFLTEVRTQLGRRGKGTP